MNRNESYFIAAILFGITVMAGVDLITDSREGVLWWHLALEASVGVAAIIGIFLLMRGSFALKHSLANEKLNASRLQLESEKWRAQSRKYLQGLSLAIDMQLNEWKLSNSEKEITFLLLKGLSLKEIANIRSTSERTTRTQSIAIYAKAGVGGRSELAAYFLEDLLLPSNSIPEIL